MIQNQTNLSGRYNPFVNLWNISFHKHLTLYFICSFILHKSPKNFDKVINFIKYDIKIASYPVMPHIKNLNETNISKVSFHFMCQWKIDKVRGKKQQFSCTVNFCICLETRKNKLQQSMSIIKCLFLCLMLCFEPIFYIVLCTQPLY